MQSWQHEIGDVLIIEHKGVEQVARIAGYVDQLDDSKPLYVNLRISGGLRWGERQVKVQPGQIKGTDPQWYQRQHDEHMASLKRVADAAYARMSPEQRQQTHKLYQRLHSRSPLDVMIDRACGIE